MDLHLLTYIARFSCKGLKCHTCLFSNTHLSPHLKHSCQLLTWIRTQPLVNELKYPKVTGTDIAETMVQKASRRLIKKLLSDPTYDISVNDG